MADLAMAAQQPETLLWHCLEAAPVGMLAQLVPGAGGDTLAAGADPAGLPPQPMHHSADRAMGELRFFVPRQAALCRRLTPGVAAQYTVTAPDSGVYLALSGPLAEDTDRLLAQQLWTPTAAAWFASWFGPGAEDAGVALLSLRLRHARLWACDGAALAFGPDAATPGIHRTLTFAA